jgi:long-chain fatty acid transport protein
MIRTKIGVKVLAFICLGGTLLFNSIKEAEGNAYYFYGLGSRAGSLGYAYIGLADDPSAIYWNPAGLTQIEHNEIMAGLWYMNEYRYVDSDSVSNKDIIDLDQAKGDHFFSLYDDEPKRFRNTFLPPFLAFVGDLGIHLKLKGFDLGLGFYTPIGIRSKWEDSFFTPSFGLDYLARMDGKWNLSFFQTVTNLSVAKEINPRLSLGAGFNFLSGYMNLDAHKSFLDIDTPARNYSYDLEENAFGWGVEGVFGIMFKIRNNLSLGGVYRTGSNLRWHGNARLRHTGLKVEENSDFSWRLMHPPTWGIGIAFRPTNRLLIVLDWQHQEWTKADLDYDFHKNGLLLLRDTGKDLNWISIADVKMGIEYKLNNQIKFQGGYGLARTPAPPGGNGITSLSVPGNTPLFTFGTTINGSKGWTYNIHLEHHFEPYRFDVKHRCIAISLGISKVF